MVEFISPKPKTGQMARIAVTGQSHHPAVVSSPAAYITAFPCSVGGPGAFGFAHRETSCMCLQKQDFSRAIVLPMMNLLLLPELIMKCVFFSDEIIQADVCLVNSVIFAVSTYLHRCNGQGFVCGDVYDNMVLISSVEWS